MPIKGGSPISVVGLLSGANSIADIAGLMPASSLCRCVDVASVQSDGEVEDRTGLSGEHHQDHGVTAMTQAVLKWRS